MAKKGVEKGRKIHPVLNIRTLLEIISEQCLHNKKCGKSVTFLQGVRSKERDKKVHSYV
jgi:hypothetical protein